MSNLTQQKSLCTGCLYSNVVLLEWSIPSIDVSNIELSAPPVLTVSDADQLGRSNSPSQIYFSASPRNVNVNQ